MFIRSWLLLPLPLRSNPSRPLPTLIIFFHPHHVCGRYQEYVGRFRSIFSAPPSVPVYYIPGNHDVGLGSRRNTSSFARPRYRSAFGPLAQHVVLGGHSLFMVDAPALVDEDLRRENAGEDRANGLPRDLGYLQHLRAENAASMYFMPPRWARLMTDDFMQRYALDPVYSHSPVPPARIELRAATRERKHPLRTWGGLPNSTQPRNIPTTPRRTPTYTHFQVLRVFPPAAFVELTNTDSADDHDYCEYIHTSHDRQIPEVTIKSFSIAMGIRQPGFQLLSLSSNAHTNAHQQCLLPDQVHIYCWVYAPLILATIVLVAARAPITAPSYNQKHIPKRSKDLLPYPTLQQLRTVPAHRRSYRLRVAQDMWAVTWPPVGVYLVIALMAFW